MSISTRELIKKAYPHSKTWAKKVDRMPEAQVFAVYINLKKAGKL
jgi:hypothetical protein